MKRYIKTAYVISFVALALASCSKAEEFQYNPDSALQIESVSGISPFSLMQEPATKAVITGDSLPGDEAAKGIGLFVTATGGGAYDGHDKGYTNVKYTFDGSKWSTQSPIYLSDNDGNLYGYFPYNADATDLHAIPVESSLNGTDYLYAEPQEVSFGKPVTIQMKHALARLHLTIVKGENYKGSGTLSGITLTSTAIGATGTLDLTDGTVAAQKGAGSMGVVPLTADGTIDKTGLTKDILLVTGNRTAVSSDLAISLAIDGTVAGVSLSSDNGVVICQGVQYNLTLTVEDTGIKITGIGVGEWGEGGCQRVQVGAHVVTVKFADEQNIEKDVFVMTNIDGDVVKIEAIAKSDNALGYSVTGKATCSRTKTGSFYVFTISGISSDVTVEIGYKVAVENITLDRTSVNPALGWRVSLSAEVLPEDAVIKDVIWSSDDETIARVDDYGTVTTFTEGEAYITATAKDGSGVTATCKITVGPAIAGSLSGEFSVSITKKVHFSQGNLYYDGNTFNFETNQYNYHTYDSNTNTWGLFGWSTNKSNYGMTISENSIDYSGDFKDWGEAIDNKGTWTTLSGGESGEWKYLVNHHVNIRGTCNSVTGQFIAPDNFVGGTAALSAIVSDWKTAQDAGIVFLPAAGWRYGSDLYDVGDYGNYWSSTFADAYDAYNVNFNSLFVYLDKSDALVRGCSVRLITESK